MEKNAWTYKKLDISRTLGKNMKNSMTIKDFPGQTKNSRTSRTFKDSGHHVLFLFLFLLLFELQVLNPRSARLFLHVPNS